MTGAIGVCLAGGLGNQLFQLAAGLDAANGSELRLISNLSYPRSHLPGSPDIAGFELPKLVTVRSVPRKPEPPSMNMRVADVLLRNSTSKNRFNRSRASWACLELAASAALSALHRTPVWVLASTSVGFEPRLRKVKNGALLIGYFQTPRYFSNSVVREQMRALRLAASSRWVRDGARSAAKTHPLVVHIRLGDYLLDPKFGGLTRQYYQTAIQSLRDRGHGGPLWLFSDEPEKALLLLPEPERGRAHVITPPPTDSHPAHSLELMRGGSAYVLSHSTYGWWGATLSHSQTSDVCAPDPWVTDGGLGELSDLNATGWTSVKRNGLVVTGRNP